MKSARAQENDKKRLEHEVEGTAGGAVAGAAIGMIAGPPGAAVGALVGAVVGAITGAAMEHGEEAEAKEERKLDREIGVSGGEMGAPNLKHPPAKIGAYSGGSAGVGSAPSEEEVPAEGPMQEPE